MPTQYKSAASSNNYKDLHVLLLLLSARKCWIINPLFHRISNHRAGGINQVTHHKWVQGRYQAKLASLGPQWHISNPKLHTMQQSWRVVPWQQGRLRHPPRGSGRQQPAEIWHRSQRRRQGARRYAARKGAACCLLARRPPLGARTIIMPGGAADHVAQHEERSRRAPGKRVAAVGERRPSATPPRALRRN